MGKRVARGFFEGIDEVFRRGVSRTFAVYEDLCAISVRPHQYCLIVYLFLCQAGLQVDDFQQLGCVSLFICRPSWWCNATGRKTHGIGDAVGEPHELNVVAGTLPVGIQGQDQPQGGGLRVGVAV